jgi:aspartate beta-hydroxylase
VKRLNVEGTLEPFVSTDGVPNSIAFDTSGALFVTDLAQKCIKSAESNDSAFRVLVGDYEGKQFAGPNSLCFDKDGTLFFTDSGPLGDTSLSRPKGSVFCVKVEDQLLKPLALECLAYPSGIAANAEGTIIYVSEMMTNRILRFVRRPNDVYYSSVFYTFTGGFGPSALACDSDGRLFVARFEFGGLSSSGSPLAGLISVIGADGRLVAEVDGPGPEIMGLALQGDETLLVAEQSSCSVYSALLADILML